MSLLEDLTQRWFNMNARFWGRECARVMLFAFSVKWRQYEERRSDSLFIAGKALSTRLKWKQIDETTFTYEPSGLPVDISGDAPVLRAIHAVIEIEYDYLLGKRKGMTLWERAQMLHEAHRAADQYAAKWASRP